MGHFAFTGAEQNNLDLLKEIVKYGGDEWLSSSYIKHPMLVS
jgi:hypothetical protein